LGELITQFAITSPETGNELGPVIEFNLMFDSSIGPTGNYKGFLRPETAQGQFLNFKKLLEFNNDRMPFASASIGKSFRNEISPRSGLIRVREFLMAEIEHFVDPQAKDHPRFDEVKDVELNLLAADVQLSGSTQITKLPIGYAVEQSIVDNKTLGYFLARIQLFLMRIGIKPDKLRFRQHMKNEMAHYACDCWDAEIQTSYGWIECVGCADRSAYDLTVHAKRTNEKLVVRDMLPEPVTVQRVQLTINKKVFGPKFKKNAKAVEDALLELNEADLQELQAKLEAGNATIVGKDGQAYEIDGSLLAIEQVTVTEHVREYTPNVIEPSFGIGRILYALMEHSWWTRPEDEQRGVLSFPVSVAPIKCLVQPLSNHASFSPFVKDIASRLRKIGISNRVDNSSASVGKTYARNDELGTPYGITVDFQTVKDNSITLRERDTTKQIRESTEVILQVVEDLVHERTTWSDVMAKYPVFVQQELE
jgi:glycyl-tRNA synthetase